MEYPSYGLYGGREPSSSAIEADAESVLLHLVEERNVPLENILVMGRSLGTGPACYLASRYKELKGIILMSAYTSLRDVANDKSLGLANIFVKVLFRIYI
jgi:pimeloyl-ACP methyl ester carboxylesterase